VIAIVGVVVVTVIVKPAIVVPGAVREELTLGVVLANCLAVRGGVQVGDVKDLVLSLGATHAIDKVVLTGEMFLAIITVIEVRIGRSIRALVIVITLLAGGKVTGSLEITLSPMLSSPFDPMTPVVAARVVLTDSLAVAAAGHVLNG